MAVSENAITIRVSNEDKAAFVELARRLDKNRSEAFRMIVRTTLEILHEADAKKERAAMLAHTRGKVQ